jgi:hypothetical protein
VTLGKPLEGAFVPLPYILALKRRGFTAILINTIRLKPVKHTAALISDENKHKALYVN